MKWIAISFVLISCSKQKFMYKYEYTTPKSIEAGRVSTHLGDYEYMNASQIEAERIYQRKLVECSTNEKVLHDSLYIYNNY